LQPPLGLPNPLLYSLRSGFFDVTTGNNAGSGEYGFNAAPGWDPVTGLGTLDFEALLSAALAL
jgi:tripeptidyl-peptidase-1